jgi:phosphoribosylamine-glycine ligase
MNCILIVGSGAREVVIIKKLLEDSKKIKEEIKIICVFVLLVQNHH